jgi:hypothetical protein
MNVVGKCFKLEVPEFQVVKSPGLLALLRSLAGVVTFFACLCFGWRGTSGTGSDEFANLHDKGQGANHDAGAVSTTGSSGAPVLFWVQ